MNKKITIIIKQWIVPIICFSLVVSMGTTAWAEPDEQPGEESSQAGVHLLNKKVTLNKKSSTMVSTTTGERFSVNTSILVVGENGQQVMLQYLLVPCQAQLLYEEKSDGTKLVHRIKVLSTLANATNQMSEKPK